MQWHPRNHPRHSRSQCRSLCSLVIGFSLLAATLALILSWLLATGILDPGAQSETKTARKLDISHLPIKNSESSSTRTIITTLAPTFSSSTRNVPQNVSATELVTLTDTDIKEYNNLEEKKGNTNNEDNKNDVVYSVSPLLTLLTGGSKEQTETKDILDNETDKVVLEVVRVVGEEEKRLRENDDVVIKSLEDNETVTLEDFGVTNELEVWTLRPNWSTVDFNEEQNTKSTNNTNEENGDISVNIVTTEVSEVDEVNNVTTEVSEVDEVNIVTTEISEVGEVSTSIKQVISGEENVVSNKYINSETNTVTEVTNLLTIIDDIITSLDTDTSTIQEIEDVTTSNIYEGDVTTTTNLEEENIVDEVEVTTDNYLADSTPSVDLVNDISEDVTNTKQLTFIDLLLPDIEEKTNEDGNGRPRGF